MMNSRTTILILLCLLVIGLGAGCTGTTSPATFYSLRPIDDSGSMQPTELSEPMAIGIGPIKFPDELERAPIVTRTGRNRLEINEFHRWGGSLRMNFTRVMEENLALLMKTDKVMARPWERFFDPDVRVALDIRQFDGHLGEFASLNVTWMIVGPEGDKSLLVRRTIIQETVADESYDALVDAQSRAIAKLCREIAMALSEHFPVQ